MKTKDALKERIEIQNEEKPTMTECVRTHSVDLSGTAGTPPSE